MVLQREPWFFFSFVNKSITYCCITPYHDLRELHWLVLWFCSILWLMILTLLLWFRPPHHPPRTRNGQQPHRHHDHPVQQYWQRLVQGVHASGSQWAGVFVAEAQWRVGIHRPARHRQPHRRSIRENGVFGSLPVASRCHSVEKWYYFNCCQVYVAVFSISGYAWASWRYRYKPFNPVLGETYETHREDRGFHYVSEQVIRRVNNVSKPQNPSLANALMLRDTLFSG